MSKKKIKDQSDMNIYFDSIRNTYRICKNGKSKRGFPTKLDAMIYLRDHQDEFSSNVSHKPEGLSIKPKESTDNKTFTFQDAYNLLLENHIKPNCTQGTYKKALAQLNNHISLLFDVNAEFISITKEQCVDFENNVKKLPHSTETKNGLIKRFKQVFRFANKKTKYSNTSFECIDNAKYTSKEKQKYAERRNLDYWDTETFYKFYMSLPNEKYKLFFEVLYWSAARIGEVKALKWSVFDEKARSIKILCSVSKKENGGDRFTKSTKTDNSVRSVVLPDAVCEKLSTFRNKQRLIPGFDDEWFIFNRYDGKRYKDGYLPLAQTNIDRIKDAAIESSGVRKVRSHDLRGSMVSLMLSQGVDVTEVARMAGDNVDTIVNRYIKNIDRGDELSKKRNQLYESAISVSNNNQLKNDDN